MQFFKSSVYIITYLCTFYSNVYCDETHDRSDDVTPATNEELQNIYSFFYLSEEKDSSNSITQVKKNDQFSKEIAQVKKNDQFSKEIAQVKKNDQFSKEIAQVKKNDQFSKEICRYNLDEQNQAAIFYKRLLTLLLSNFAIQKIDEDDKLIGSLNMETSILKFEYLKNFVNGQGSIREVDRILEDMIKPTIKYDKTFVYTMYHYIAEMSYLLLEHLIYFLLLMKEHWDITIISLPIILTIIYNFTVLTKPRWSRRFVIFLMFDIIFVISYFLTWWRLIKEAEIKLMAAQTQFAEMPIACQPHKMGIWDKIMTWFFSAKDCEKYYESIMTNPKLQVTPAYVLTYFLSTVIFQPFSSFGLFVSEFIDNATSKLNFISKFFITTILYLTVCICMVLLLILWMNGSIKFGIGPFFKFGIKSKKNSNKQERIERMYEHTLPKQLEGSKIKQILLIQENKDPAGGDADIDIHHLKNISNEKYIKCKCENKNADESVENKDADESVKNKDADESVENEKKEERDDDY